MVLNVVGMLLGFVREQVIAARFGTTMLTDSYVMAFTLPNLIFIIIGGALATAFIPVFTDISLHKSRQDAARMSSTIINLTLVTMVLLAIPGIVLAPYLVSAIAPGFTGETRDLTILLTRIMFPCIIFMSTSLLLGGILNALKHFSAPALYPAIFSSVIIVSVYLLSPAYGVVGLAVGTLLAAVVQMLFAVPFLRRQRIPYHLEIKPSLPGVKQVFNLMLPAMLGTSINQLSIFIDRFLASGLVEGSIAALNFASRLMMLPYNLFVNAITTAVFPSLSEMAAREDYAEMGRTTVFGLNLILFFTIPAAVGLFILSEPVVRLLFEHGVFDARSTQMTVFALRFYMLAMVSQGAYTVMNRTFFAMQDTKTPVKISMVDVAVNLTMSLLLIGTLQHGGLALGTSIGTTVNMVLVYIFLRRRIQTLPEKRLALTLGKIILASAIMGAGVYFFALELGMMLDLSRLYNQLIHVISSVVFGIVLYALAIIPMKIEEVDYVRTRIRERIGG
ncbi:MAG TPA: murein biosynthesis integral membrane protein MurJ [Syntrophomonadaceae bacterium]|nr:murein biosynthesis integral membrane protein MurJ [Syntrophomonadaceae bacterium]